VSVFTETELTYLQGDAGLGRIATVGADGQPHVTPVGWRVDAAAGVIEVGGMDFAKTKKYRDVQRTGRAAIVIDDVRPPWRPRGIEIRGPAEAVPGPEPHIRIRPERIIAWGLDDENPRHQARTVR
jgi:pyridoxamine 5'-phosphate oxidase family protein